MATESTFYDKNWTVLQKLKYLEQWFKANAIDPTTIEFNTSQEGNELTVIITATAYDGETYTLPNITFDTLGYTFKAVANTLEEGAEATVSFDISSDYVITFTFGIPVGATGKQGIQGEQGVTGIGIFYTTKILEIGLTTELSESDITIPTGYELVVGSLILDLSGNLGQVNEILSDSEIEVKYLETLKNGGASNTYRHNIAIYFNRDDMDCAAISFTLINQSDSAEYTIPTGTTFAVSGIVYPNSNTAYVATRLTSNTSGEDTIYTIGYWNFPNAGQLTFDFTSNDDITIEHTVELLDISGQVSYTAGTGIDITGDTISVKTSSVALEAEGGFVGVTATQVTADVIIPISDYFSICRFSMSVSEVLSTTVWRGSAIISSSITDIEDLGSYLNSYYNASFPLTVIMYNANSRFPYWGFARIYGDSTVVSGLGGFLTVPNYTLYGASEQTEITMVDTSTTE